ncbi:MAG TPA: peptide chain release factor N(5)-glutamine methyltransferase [Bryobacteraceae bacterium]|nr:peptide chain release factor N(5)-glutamine methyltransferase [Bryobacteraceae bacterium]
MNIQTALVQGTELLEKSGIHAPRLTSEVLLCHAMRCERAYLYAHGTDELTQIAWIHYGRYLNERLKGKPTQYITKKQEFYGREFRVTPDVLIPRPETEHLVEAAVAAIRARDHIRILDVGTGSGAIAVSVALETGRTVCASDISCAAVAVAGQNRDTYGASVALFVTDLASAVDTRSIDLLISNPPYVPGGDAANMQQEVRDWEPHLALFAGDSGLEIYDRLIRQAEGVVRPGGEIMMELGYQSLTGVREILTAKWREINVVHDLAGWPRVVTAIRG